MASITLTRGDQSPFAPVPQAVRAGDYIVTSSIYPIDESGHALEVDERVGESGPSLTGIQTRACLETLSHLLEQHGSALERVVKASVHLVDAADFYEFKLGVARVFPRRTTGADDG